jgi:hypothetical protein
MSIIIDDMDQNHCSLPYLGSQSSFENPLNQIIVGVKNHSKGSLSIFRAVNTVSKGSNLTMHCILSELELWNYEKGSYPEELYVQVDGGSENANKYVLALLELLVVKGVCRLIYYTRLPVGHTHEDIDACFGVIWGTFRNNPCLTPNEYKERIKSAFGEGSTLKVDVQDLFVIPNYSAFLESFIDKKLARLHKDFQTQHQWRFEQVLPSSHFPFGCKTTYRAYSSEKVVELIKKTRYAVH